ncbi:MAG TPA: hypothetical protein VH459_10945 [Gaiellales bacterium]
MDARSLRTYAIAAAVPAAVVIIGHLAWAWHAHPSSADRQAAAFDHGVALAAILAATLVAGRAALWLEGRAWHVWSDTAAVIGAVAILAHLAAAWRDEGVGDVGVAFVHVAALGGLAVTVNLIRAFEEPRRRA